MTLPLKSKPGLTGASQLSIPATWDPTWFRKLIHNQLKGADVRNAVGVSGIAVSGTIASPYATIGFSAPVTLPGQVIITAPSTAIPTVIATPFATNGAAFEAAGAGSSAAGFYNQGTLNAALVMNSAGADYGIIGNSGTQTWGLGFNNAIGPTGLWAAQWGQTSNASTFAVGPGTFTAAGSIYQATTRAVLMMDGATGGDSLIDFTVNGTTGGFIQHAPGSYFRWYTNSLPILFSPGTINTGYVITGNTLFSTNLPGFATIGASTFQRNSPLGGYLDGNYANAEAVGTPGCIYTIGGTTYVPTATTFGAMYGIAYQYTSSPTSTLYGTMAVQANTWGMAVIQDGTANIWLAANGNGLFTGAVGVQNAYNCMYSAVAGNTLFSAGGKVTAQSGGTASGGNPGDIILIY